MGANLLMGARDGCQPILKEVPATSCNLLMGANLF
jgi:hypothetical protein